MQRVARRPVYVSMLSSSYRFVPGDPPSSKWLLICIWQSGTEPFKTMFVSFIIFMKSWSFAQSDRCYLPPIQPLECSDFMASHLWIDHDEGWGGLLCWELEALRATDYNLKRESEKVALFHVDFIAVSEAQRKPHCRVDGTTKRSWSTMSVEPRLHY